MNQQEQARIFNQQLERFLDQSRASAPPGDGLVGDSSLWAVSARLAALPDLLPPVDAAFEQRLWARLRAVGANRVMPWGRLPGWMPRSIRVGLPLAVSMAAILLLIVLSLPGPRQALATWVASFQVGGVEVAVTSEETGRLPLASTIQPFGSLVEAEAAAGFDFLEPAYLPVGYELTGVEAVTFDQLPVWLQPLYVEASYQPVDPGNGNIRYFAVLREFNAAQAGGVKVGQIEFPSEMVQSATDVTLPNDLPAVLVRFEAAVGADQILLRQLIWEQSGLTIELWSEVLPEAEMIELAASLR